MFAVDLSEQECTIPPIIRSDWFSWENGQNTKTVIDADSMNKEGSWKGWCVDSLAEFRVNYSFVFQEASCYRCVKIFVRTSNVLDKLECKLKSIQEYCKISVAQKEKCLCQNNLYFTNYRG